MPTRANTMMAYRSSSAVIMLYAHILRHHFLCLGLIVFSNLAFGQNTPASTAFYQVVEHSYGIPEGLPDVCIRKVVLDSRGRLHLAGCENVYASSSLLMYNFDGSRAYSSGFMLAHDPEIVFYGEVPAPDMIYGFYEYRNETDSIRRAVFQYDALTETTRCFDIKEPGVVKYVTAASGSLFVCLYEPGSRQCKIVQIRSGAISSLYTIDLESQPGGEEIKLSLAVTEKDFWVAQSAGHIYRINRKDGTQRHFSLPGAGKTLKYVKQLLPFPGNDIWINCDGIYRWDAATDHFFRNPYLPAT